MPPNSLSHDEMSSIGKTKNITKLEVGQVILVKQTKCQFPSLTGLGIRAARRNIYLMACWHFFQTPPPSSGWGLTSPSHCQTQRHIQEHGWLTAGTGRGRAGGGWSSDPPVGASSRDGDRGLKKRPACWALPGIYALYSCASLRSMKTTPKVLWIEEGMVQSQLPHIERHQGFNLHGIGPRAEYLNIILWEQREPSQGHPRSTGARSFHKKPSAAWGGDEREGEARVIWECSHQVWRLLPNQHKHAAGRKQGAKAWAAQSAQGSSCPLKTSTTQSDARGS